MTADELSSVSEEQQHSQRTNPEHDASYRTLMLLERTMTAEKECELAQLQLQHHGLVSQSEMAAIKAETKLAVMEAEAKMKEVHRVEKERIEAQARYEKSALLKDVELREARWRLQIGLSAGLAATCVAITMVVATARGRN